MLPRRFNLGGVYLAGGGRLAGGAGHVVIRHSRATCDLSIENRASNRVRVAGK